MINREKTIVRFKIFLKLKFVFLVSFMNTNVNRVNNCTGTKCVNYDARAIWMKTVESIWCLKPLVSQLYGTQCNKRIIEHIQRTKKINKKKSAYRIPVSNIGDNNSNILKYIRRCLWRFYRGNVPVYRIFRYLK